MKKHLGTIIFVIVLVVLSLAIFFWPEKNEDQTIPNPSEGKVFINPNPVKPNTNGMGEAIN